MPVQREGHFVESGADRLLEEIGIAEALSVADDLDVRETEPAGQGDDVQESRMDRGLAAAQDHAAQAPCAGVRELPPQVLESDDVPVLGVPVEAEEAALVAVAGEPQPMAFFGDPRSVLLGHAMHCSLPEGLRLNGPERSQRARPRSKAKRSQNSSKRPSASSPVL